MGFFFELGRLANVSDCILLGKALSFLKGVPATVFPEVIDELSTLGSLQSTSGHSKT